METLLAVLAGALVAIAVHLLTSRNLIRVLAGFIVMSNAVNLAILAVGRLTSFEPPLIPGGRETAGAAIANPLPQALILTAIVISFGLLIFTLALIHRGRLDLHTFDSDRIRLAEPPPDSDRAGPEGSGG